MDNKNPKYNSLAEWKKAEPKAYLAAKNKGLLDEICNLFGWSSKIKFEDYTEDEIFNLALRCKTFDAFVNNHKKAYYYACILNIEEKVKEAIEKKPKQKKRLYDKDYVLELVGKSSSYFSFCKEYKTASEVATKNNWNKEIFEIFDKKSWEAMKDVRAFCVYTQSKEFLSLFDEFKKTYVDIPYVDNVRYYND